MEKVRFGIIGTGNIADKFCTACGLTEDADAYAVASRRLETAQAFACAHGVEMSYGSLSEMLDNPLVDCVYVATPHPMHFENCREALLKGKPVLCEKPFTLNRHDAETLFALAREKGLFLMEGMWTRFLPGSRQALEWLQNGEIGQLKLMDFAFCYRVEAETAPERLVSPAYAGGSLYDVGVYGLEMASFFAGVNPEAFQGLATDYGPGVDAMFALTLRYPGGILATVRSAITCTTPCHGILYGTKGRIEIDTFYLASGVRLIRNEQVLREISFPGDVPQGFRFQVRAVCDALRQGKTRSDVVSPEDTIASMAVLGDLMKQAYPAFYGPSLV